ncbi:MAG: hypothetical protein IPJ41_12145 [Phycisphaerales bacterium]|nr:hypothetical protein [Phycisphaerales bacterium]
MLSPRTGLFIAVLGFTRSGLAQPAYTWRAIDLHPPEAHHSEAVGVSRAGIAGNPSWNGNPSISGASLWFGRKQPWSLLREPDRQYIPLVYGADEDAQCGYDIVDGAAHAALWFGSRESLLDLHPPGYFTSAIRDALGGMAVGQVSVAGKEHAAVWIDLNKYLMIDLHPGDPKSSSTAFATDGRWQGGSAGLAEYNTSVAVLWKGTRDSMVVMVPPGFGPSSITGMSAGTQVGTGLTVTDGGLIRDHALLWHDTPESWIDMNPSFAADKDSYLWGTTGQIHCGQSAGHAGVWFGDDPDSFTDLHRYVPGNPSGASRAVDIDVYDGTVFIAGRATFDNGRTHAVVWIGTPAGFGLRRNRPRTHNKVRECASRETGVDSSQDSPHVGGGGLRACGRRIAGRAGIHLAGDRSAPARGAPLGGGGRISGRDRRKPQLERQSLDLWGLAVVCSASSLGRCSASRTGSTSRSCTGRTRTLSAGTTSWMMRHTPRSGLGLDSRCLICIHRGISPQRSGTPLAPWRSARYLSRAKNTRRCGSISTNT